LKEAIMRDSASSPIVRIEPATDAPAAREVISEIGLILAAHLALALIVAVVLRALGQS
jgi:hypothetical protein